MRAPRQPARLDLTRRQALRLTPVAAVTGLVWGAGTVPLARAQSVPPPSASVPAIPPALAEGVQMTVAGPEGGELDGWSRVIGAALAGSLPDNVPLRRGLAGGVDGTTGANQFAAQAVPDGSAALMLPGQAMLSWLRGDATARFEPTKWMPLLAGLRCTMILGRRDAPALQQGQALRFGAGGGPGLDLAAELGLGRLGVKLLVADGFADQPTTMAAFRLGTIDLMALRGAAVGQALAEGSTRPICVMGLPDEQGVLARDPAWPEVPQLGELLGGLAEDALGAAWRAAAVATQLDFGLVLPVLAEAPVVALWRHAVERAIATPELQALASTEAIRLRTDPAATQAITAEPAALAALRTWMARRAG